jgi:hypothetical protein
VLQVHAVTRSAANARFGARRVAAPREKNGSREPFALLAAPTLRRRGEGLPCGGLLANDWQTVNQDKQSVLAPLLAPSL